MKFAYKKVLVTGGAGFIGSHLVDALLSNGCEVRVVDDLSTGSISNLEHVKDRISFYQRDICDREKISEVVQGCDAIFHLAAMVAVPLTVANPVGSAKVNELGYLFILEAARKHRVKRVIFSSSCAIYGDDPIVPKNESMDPKPQSPYAVQKLAGEYYARLYFELFQLETVCLRYFNVYGPRQDPSSPYSGVISIFMSKASSKSTPVIYDDGEQYRDFIFVEDVVRANLFAANTDKAVGNIYNIGTGKFVRINEVWSTIGKLSDYRIDPEYQPPRAGDIRESVADIGRAKKDLGFEPECSFEEGLEITYRWYKEQQNFIKL